MKFNMKYWKFPAVFVFSLFLLPGVTQAQHYKQTNLVSNIAGRAPVQDSNLKNPWGLTRSSGSPWYRADLAVANMAATVDDISFGHAVDPEIDRGSAIAIDADVAERIAETFQEAARSLGFILVGDAVEGDAGLARQRHQLRVFFAARGAPRRKEVDERHPAAKVFPRQSFCPLVETRQGKVGDWAIDQC